MSTVLKNVMQIEANQCTNTRLSKNEKALRKSSQAALQEGPDGGNLKLLVQSSVADSTVSKTRESSSCCEASPKVSELKRGKKFDKFDESLQEIVDYISGLGSAAEIFFRK